jgi:hypothetical protein
MRVEGKFWKEIGRRTSADFVLNLKRLLCSASAYLLMILCEKRFPFFYCNV